jgi:hypothetical protein
MKLVAFKISVFVPIDEKESIHNDPLLVEQLDILAENFEEDIELSNFKFSEVTYQEN